MKCDNCRGEGRVWTVPVEVDGIVYPARSVPCFVCDGYGDLCDICGESWDACGCSDERMEDEQ